MKLRILLDEGIKIVHLGGHALRVVAHALVSGIEEQVERKRLAGAADELQHRTIKSGNRDFRNLRGLIEVQFSGIELNLDLRLRVEIFDECCLQRHQGSLRN